MKKTEDGIIKKGFGEVTGNPGGMHSFRMVVQGAAKVLLGSDLDSLKQAIVYIDNQGVVRKITNGSPLHSLQVEWEVLEPTRRYVQKNQVRVEHIKSHQDLNDATTPWESHQNHKVDRVAEKSHEGEGGTGHLPKGYGVILHIEGHLITSHYGKAIMKEATMPYIVEF